MALRAENMASMSALTDAAVSGNTEEVLRVVHMGMDISTQNYDGQTVLHIMAKAGNKNGVEACLKEGVDVSLRGRWGRTAMQVCHRQTLKP